MKRKAPTDLQNVSSLFFLLDQLDIKLDVEAMSCFLFFKKKDLFYFKLQVCM